MTGPALANTASSGARHYRDTLPPCELLAELGYQVEPDVDYPSVTTVIGHGIPKKVLYLEGDDRQPVTSIDKWELKAAAEYAVDARAEWQPYERDAAVKLIKTAGNRVRDAAGKRGSDVHDIVERLAAGQLVPSLSDDLEPWIASARAFVADFRPNVVWSETTVFNRQFGYAGTLDLIADFPGYGRMIADYKTSSRVYGSTGAQLAAYRYAEYGVRDVALPPGEFHRYRLPDGIEGGLIINLTDQGYSVVPVECGTKELDAFLCAIGVADFCAGADQLLGTPLRPVDHSGDDLALVKAWLVRRIQVLLGSDAAAGQQLADRWPEGVPTMGQPAHTADDLAQIERLLDTVEAAHSVPFGEAKPAPAGTTNIKTKTKTNKRKQTAA